MTKHDFERLLALLCREAFGGERAVEGLRRLSGGANMESWSFAYGDRQLVLRRLPGGGRLAPADDNLGSISLDAQAELIEAARRAGVRAPAVRARLEPRHGLGAGFLMARVDGETLPHRILGKPEYAAAEAKLAQQCARELARIHALDPARLPHELRYRAPLELVAEQERKYRALGAQLPVFDFAFGWLGRNAPEPTAPAVLHGDFRMGNLIIDRDGIAAVLDWELAHLGDPARDLAYLCTPSWRFGHYDKAVGGFDRVDALLAAYRAESGRAIPPERLRYWLVFSSLWWGLVCLAMGQLWRGGADRSLERAVIGRRVSEVEIDLLLLFDEELELGQGRGGDLSWEPPAEPSGSGEIAGHELLAALGEWARESVQPHAHGHALFEARVAGNALGIARRHAAWGAEFARAESARLAAIGLDNEALCRSLCEGSLSLDDDAVWRHLRLRALARMAVDQPGYAGFRRALARWCRHHGRALKEHPA
jgi:aminoglycoside phosphotransferase (APT) family kinase protein